MRRGRISDDGLAEAVPVQLVDTNLFVPPQKPEAGKKWLVEADMSRRGTMETAGERTMEAAAGDSVFTMKRPIRFKPEGSTMNSLANAKAIQEAGYKFVKGVYTYEGNMGDYFLAAFFERDDETAVHTFRGFSFGYGGEGPHGMMEFGRIFGLGLKEDKVMSREYKESLPKSGTFDLVHVFG